MTEMTMRYNVEILIIRGVWSKYMVFKYNKKIYPKVVIIKAAYHFTDIAYIHLDCDEVYYIVSIEPKLGAEIDEKSFENETLAQVARYEVFQQTKNIREIPLARALASSVVEKNDNIDTFDLVDSDVADDILRDWFENNEWFITE